MTKRHTSRRTFLGALALTPVIVVPAVAAPSGDAAVLAAWQVRQQTLALIMARGTYFDCETHSPELADIYDEADNRIVTTEATTAQGALAQAWVHWSFTSEHSADDKRIGDLIRRADFAALEAEKELDWHHVTMLQLVRTLRHLAGVA